MHAVWIECETTGYDLVSTRMGTCYVVFDHRGYIPKTVVASYPKMHSEAMLFQAPPT